MVSPSAFDPRSELPYLGAGSLAGPMKKSLPEFRERLAAETEGFEPSSRDCDYFLSREAVSASHPRLRHLALYARPFEFTGF